MKCDQCGGTGEVAETPPPQIEEPMLKSLHFPDEKGGLSANISHSAVPILAEHFISLLKESKGAVNYLELTMSHKGHADIGEIVVTIQKKNGHTPGAKASTYQDVLKKIVAESNCDKEAHMIKSTCPVCVATDALTKFEAKA